MISDYIKKHLLYFLLAEPKPFKLVLQIWSI